MKTPAAGRGNLQRSARRKVRQLHPRTARISLGWKTKTMTAAAAVVFLLYRTMAVRQSNSGGETVSVQLEIELEIGGDGFVTTPDITA